MATSSRTRDIHIETWAVSNKFRPLTFSLVCHLRHVRVSFFGLPLIFPWFDRSFCSLFVLVCSRMGWLRIKLTIYLLHPPKASSSVEFVSIFTIWYLINHRLQPLLHIRMSITIYKVLGCNLWNRMIDPTWSSFQDGRSAAEVSQTRLTITIEIVADLFPFPSGQSSLPIAYPL